MTPITGQKVLSNYFHLNNYQLVETVCTHPQKSVNQSDVTFPVITVILNVHTHLEPLT